MWFLIKNGEINTRTGRRPAQCTIDGGTQTVMSRELAGTDEDGNPIYRQVLTEQPCTQTVVNPTDEQLSAAGWVESNPPVVEWYQLRSDAQVVDGSIVWLVANHPLETVKAMKRDMIRQEYKSASELPVLSCGHYWNGGRDSALALDGWRRASIESGAQSVTFHGKDNLPHELSIADATAVCLAVSTADQVAFVAKQARMNAVDAALTVNDVVDV
jgi:hypothetical protein